MRAYVRAVVLLASSWGCTRREREQPAPPHVEVLPDTQARPTAHTPPSAPAVRVAPPAGPLENLAPLWRLDDDPARSDDDWTLVDAAPRYVLFDRVVAGGCDVAIVDAVSGAMVATAPTWRGDVWSVTCAPHLPVMATPDLVAARRDYTTVVVIEAATGRERWHAALSLDWVPMAVREGTAGVVLLASSHDGLLALDAATGAVRWRWSDARVRPLTTLDASHVYALGRDEALHALELTTGHERWRWSPPGLPYTFQQIVSDGRRVMFSSNAADDVMDAHDGQNHLSHPRSPREGLMRSVVSAGHVVRANGPGTVEGWTLATQQLAWHHPGTLAASFAGSDAVYLCSEGGVLRAVDPASGQERWSWGLGMCERTWPTYRSFVRVARGTAVGDVLLLGQEHGTIAIARGGGPSPPEVAVITGRATVNHRPHAGLVVHVGDETVRTNARGRFHLTVRQRGGVLVRIEPQETVRVSGRPCAGNPGVEFVTFTGAGRYAINVDGNAVGYDCDTLCHCD